MATNVADLPFNKAELPARDVPRETIDHVTDPQVTQQYVPPKAPEYIDRHVPEMKQSKLDKLLDEFRIPIMVGVVYLLFEMPMSQSMLLRMAPSLMADASTGIFFKSVAIAVAYYAVSMGLDYMSKP
jgi:hypothetical protein